MGYVVNSLSILASIAMLIGFTTVYIPSVLAIFFGTLIGGGVFFILLYEVYTYKEESVTGMMKQGANVHKKSRLFFLLIFLVSFSVMGIYLISYSLHVFTSKIEKRTMLTVPAKPSNMRMFRCDTRVAIIDPNNLYDVSTYCANKKDYDFVVRSPVTEKYTGRRLLTVVYKVSLFGHKIDSIKSL